MSRNRTQIISPHEELSEPVTRDISTKTIVTGTYEYWHYGCDGLDDRGWGCGYRTLQTIASWIRSLASLGVEDEHLGAQTHITISVCHFPANAPLAFVVLGSLKPSPNGQNSPFPPSARSKRFQRHLPTDPTVPSLPEIQDILVTMEDKSSTFRGSREWIGSFEVCLVLDHLYDIPSKIIHVHQGSQLKAHFPTIQEHLHRLGSPIMMGGDQDCSSKGIFGALATPTSQYLLIVDPHYWGQSCSNANLFDHDWIHWRKLEDFVDSSFYNLCLPQIKAVPT